MQGGDRSMNWSNVLPRKNLAYYLCIGNHNFCVLRVIKPEDMTSIDSYKKGKFDIPFLILLAAISL